FFALSYVWGNSKISRRIAVPGQTIYITQSLGFALDDLHVHILDALTRSVSFG
ncbi:hypothetical protein B0J11DRAFT_448087, partial [Dendryphion nanum]